MDPVKESLGLTADYAAQFLDTLDERPVRAEASVDGAAGGARRAAARGRAARTRRSSRS